LGTALAEPERPDSGGEDCPTLNSAKLELNKFRSQVEVKLRAVSAVLARSGKSLPARYVPISQDARYFFCSGVSLSICTPIPASLSRAISLSMVAGTGYTFRSSIL